MGVGKSAIDFVLHLLQFAAALFIAVVLTIFLRRRGGVGCLLDGTAGATSDRVCTLTYATCAASAVGSLLISLLTCVTCCLCGIPDVIEGFGALVLAVMWGAVGGYVTPFARAADEASFANATWRRWVLWAMYGAAAAFAASSLINCGAACVGRSRGRGRDKAPSPGMV